MKDTKKNISCNCECNKIMNDIICVYDKLPDYYTPGHLSTLYELKNTTNLSYKITLNLFFSKTAAALIYRDLYFCNCCNFHFINKPRSNKIIRSFVLFSRS